MGVPTGKEGILGFEGPLKARGRIPCLIHGEYISKKKGGTRE